MFSNRPIHDLVWIDMRRKMHPVHCETVLGLFVINLCCLKCSIFDYIFSAVESESDEEFSVSC